MTKITNLDKTALQALRAPIEAELAALGERLGLKFEVGSGSYDPAGAEASFKLKLTVDDPAKREASARARWNATSRYIGIDFDRPEETGLRPEDFGTEFFTSLDALVDFTRHQREMSRGTVVPSRSLRAAPIEDDATRRGLAVIGPDDAPTSPTHWAFGQLANRVGAPAGYLRSLPADIAADALNYGVFRRPVEDMGVLLRKNGGVELAAVTGPNYGRVWNADIALALRERFGDGVTGDFTVPGEFGKAVDVNKANTTIYASDRDMFVFLADEKNRINVPGRRDGKSGTMARGFFVWNSEVGSKTLGIATFLFDYVCCNRIVWGAEGYEEIKIMHFASASTRWVEEVAPAIESYANKSTATITQAIEAAQAARIGSDKLDDFLRQRFTRGQAEGIKAAHLADEDRPIESLWDVTVGATAYARGIKYQNDRVGIERTAGKIMAMATR